MRKISTKGLVINGAVFLSFFFEHIWDSVLEKPATARSVSRLKRVNSKAVKVLSSKLDFHSEISNSVTISGTFRNTSDIALTKVVFNCISNIYLQNETSSNC